jgi:MFS family permease
VEISLRFGIFGSTKLSIKHSIAITSLLSGNIAWFFFFNNYFEPIFENSVGTYFWISIAHGLFFGFCAFSAIMGTLLGRRVNYAKFFLLWISLGVISTLAMITVQGVVLSLVFSAILGTSFGLGFPLGIALLIDRTEIRQRGKVSGLVILEAFVMVFIAINLVSFLNFGIMEIIMLGALLRSVSFVTLFLDCCFKKNIKAISWISILTQKNFFYYFFPWIMFSLVAGLANFIWYGLIQTSTYVDAYNLGSTLQFIGTALVAILSGFISDRFGRKQPIIIGVVLLVVSYAIFGFATTPLNIIIQLTTLGVAWGFLMVAYLVIPGDLAESYTQEKYYALVTALPFVVYGIFRALPRTFGLTILSNILSPLLIVLLFLSIILILYATETLHLQRVKKEK